MNLIYGPVSSWRLGRSLGIDIIDRDNAKICSFDCIYCSLGETTEKTVDRRTFVDTVEIESELKRVPEDIEVDILTVSGTGEPTLAINMGNVIDLAKKRSSLPVAVITNSSLMSREDVRSELSKADVIVGSLDASNPKLFEKINEPDPKVSFEKIVEGMKIFADEFDGMFSLEIMFVPQNKDFSKEIAAVARNIRPDEVQINTPLRTNPVGYLEQSELEEIQKGFSDLKTRSVYESKKPEIERIIGEEKLKRLKRPKDGKSS